jgi:hypothetical protein
VWALIQSLQDRKNASILTQPFVTVANNTEASIYSTETRRVVSEEALENRRGFVSLDAVTSITLKPQINLDGVIKMNVNVKISEFTGASGGDHSEKNITTSVTLSDGQVLVLGGFVKTRVEESRQKTPIFGDIPILGWFFKYKSRAINKDYTFIFIAPSIKKPRSLPGAGIYTKMKLHNATEEIRRTIKTDQVRDPIHNWFFNRNRENYYHKVVDFANARYQPTTVDMKNDPHYRAVVKDDEVGKIFSPSSTEMGYYIDRSNIGDEDNIEDDEELRAMFEDLEELRDEYDELKEKKNWKRKRIDNRRKSMLRMHRYVNKKRREFKNFLSK